MNRIKIISLLVILPHIIIVPAAYAQSTGEEIGRISAYEGLVYINGNEIQISDEEKVKIFIKDEIETGPESIVKIELLPDHIEYTLRANTRIKIEALYKLVGLEGDLEVDTRDKSRNITVLTNRENIGATGTHFLVKSRKPGTIIKVLEGSVNFTRNGEHIGTDLFQDYEAMVPSGKSLTVISPKPLLMKAGLSLTFPGTGRIYAGKSLNESILIKFSSTFLLIGIAAFEVKKDNASGALNKSYNEYKNEIELDKIKVLYARHKNKVEKAKKYRDYRNSLIALYGLLAVYDVYSTIIDDREYRKLTEEFQKLEKELKSPRFGLELQGDTILSKICWQF